MGGHDHLISLEYASAGPDGAGSTVINAERDCILDDLHTGLYGQVPEPRQIRCRMERVGLGEGDRLHGRHRYEGWIGGSKQCTQAGGQVRLFGQALAIGPIHGVEHVRAFGERAVGRAALKLSGEVHEGL
jgi:hypothetical protein